MGVVFGKSGRGRKYFARFARNTTTEPLFNKSCICQCMMPGMWYLKGNRCAVHGACALQSSIILLELVYYYNCTHNFPVTVVPAEIIFIAA